MQLTLDILEKQKPKTRPLTQDEIDDVKNYVEVGFSDRVYFTKRAWGKALTCMYVLIDLGIAKKHNFGQGKAKFDTTKYGKTLVFEDIYKELTKRGYTV